MSSPDWDNTGDTITVKDLYPIGSILVLDHPLEGVDTWFIDKPSEGDLNNPVLTVEWKGMTWEYLNDYKEINSSHSNAHILQNQPLYSWITHDPHDMYGFRIEPEQQYSGDREGFNNANSTKIAINQMPPHDHEAGCKPCGNESSGYGLVESDEFQDRAMVTGGGFYTSRTGGTSGGVQLPLYITQRSYRTYMYRRIA